MEKQTENHAYFPFFVDISGRRILVIGAGNVAERRIRTLLAFEPRIVMVAPEATEGLQKLAREEQIEWVRARADLRMIRDLMQKNRIELTLTLTDDPGFNEAVVTICREKKIPVNTSHKKELCDFYFPAVVQNGSVVVGISSGGNDYAETASVRRKVEEILT